MNETAQQYTQRILGYAEGKEPIAIQRSTARKLAVLIKGLDNRQLRKRPSAEKWSVVEILAHLADTELAVGWRLRSILTNSGTSVQAYDQDAWANTFEYRRRDPKVSLETFRTLRESNLVLLKVVSPSLWENYGVHQERGKETITRVVQLVAGHDLNHLRQVISIVEGIRKPAGAKRIQAKRIKAKRATGERK